MDAAPPSDRRAAQNADSGLFELDRLPQFGFRRIYGLPFPRSSLLCSVIGFMALLLPPEIYA